MVQSNRKTPLARPYGRTTQASTGLRPGTEALINAIDQNDPAFMFIAAELQRAKRAGEELTADAISTAVHSGRTKHKQHVQDEVDSQPGRIPESIVYYAQRGPLVKIGYTAQPHQRFRDLLPDAVLAWEPGGKPEEAARHRQFGALRVSSGAEYFRRDDSLDSHIQATREQHGAPDPTWPTLRTLPQKPRRLHLPGIPLTPHLVTLEAGTRLLGIRIGTARVWVHRGKLHHVLEDPSGARLYFLADLKELKYGGRRAARETSEEDAT